MSRADKQPEIILRRLSTQEDYLACVALQKETWGSDFAEGVPPAILMVVQKIGGVAAGAFDASGRMLGFVFGMTGVKDGRLVHWSDMLAVRPEARDLGIGHRLKMYQRDLVREIGVKSMLWTYDPLVARNAHLNLNRLGAKVSEYVVNMYGEDMAGELNRGLGTDRFVVEWDISDESAEQHATHTLRESLAVRFADAPVVSTGLDASGAPIPICAPLLETRVVRVEIPNDIQAVKSESLERAAAWRASTRRAFVHYLGREYQVIDFFREVQSDRCFYAMAKG